VIYLPVLTPAKLAASNRPEVTQRSNSGWRSAPSSRRCFSLLPAMQRSQMGGCQRPDTLRSAKPTRAKPRRWRQKISPPAAPPGSAPSSDHCRARCRFAQPPRPLAVGPYGPPVARPKPLFDGRDHRTDASQCVLARNVL